MQGLQRRYKARGHVHVAVDDVSFDLARGEVLGIVGESGCGKSSLAKAVLMLPPPDGGRVSFLGQELTLLRGRGLRAIRPHIQAVFQDPVTSLNPRHTVGQIVEAPLLVHGIRSGSERTERVAQVLHEVGLDMATHGRRRPHELSGGQCQRVSVARALVLRPQLLVCDEPVSSLDVSVQAQVINLLEEIRQRHELAILFISHDLAVVRSLCDRVLVMRKGRICELGATEALFAQPQHPYTAELLAAVPRWDGRGAGAW
ncbi:MAG: ATP-binding cassette domain-containing protein [Rubrivivax sp.]